MPLAKMLGKVWPSCKLAPFPADKKKILTNKHLRELIKDPVLEVKTIPVQNLLINDQAMKSFQLHQDKVTTPFMMILGGQDQVVSNKANKQFFETS